VAEPRLALDDVPYVLTPLDKAGTLIRRVDNPDTVNRFSQGQQTLADIEGFLPLRWPNVSLGLGRFRIDSDSAHIPDEMRRFFDSTNDTRWADGIYLPILRQTATITGWANNSRLYGGSTHYKGNFFLLTAQDNTAGAVQSIHTVTISAGTLANSTTIFTEGAASDGLRAFDLQADASSLLALVNIVSTNANYRIYRGSGATGGSWTQGAAIGAANALGLTSRQGTTYPLDGGLISPTPLAGEVVIAIYDETGDEIELYSTTDSGATTTSELQIASGGGPKGLAIYPGTDGELKVYLGTREGVYEIDTAPTTWTAELIIPMASHDDNCRRMVVHPFRNETAVWIPIGADSDQPAPIRVMVNSNNRRQIFVNEGLNKGDGIPSDMHGPIRWLQSAGVFLYGLVGGTAANRNARVICHNGRGWHSFNREDTADSTPTFLGVGLNDEIYLGPEAGDTIYFFENASANPRSGVSIKREASGYTDLPYVDGGFPLDTKTWMRFGINAEDLSASDSGEYINVERGITTDLGALAARNATEVGDFLSGTNRIALGTNGVGIAGLVLGARVNLHRASTNTNTPIWKDLQIDAVVNLPKSDRYEFLVDLDKSAKLGAKERRTTEVLADLNTARTSDVLVPIVYADLTTDYVKVLDVSYSERFESEGTQGSDANVQRRGTARVVVSEVL
jgi:hypothetical protein